MRTVGKVGWLLCGLSLMSATGVMGIDPSYIKLRSGTLAAGGLDDLLTTDRALTLVPIACVAGVAAVEVDVGFVVQEDFHSLTVAGTIETPRGCTAKILFKDFGNGRYILFDELDLTNQRFVSENIPVDSETYRERSTSEVEVRVVIRCGCGPPPTDKDDVSVQELTIGPTPK